ncbi:hypothetical protein [Bifidobacterium lemurum]|uniref:hypothetical protein n=1 Tax=Bifidobacterium lemurum TaxID=1603886 RepID=UPI0011603147|nr:hypothetical protein [Bifidobacterium lemurum]QOL34408.1 hypothetical protein BL8807_00210 [Bifidobacterium lemurum]
MADEDAVADEDAMAESAGWPGSCDGRAALFALGAGLVGEREFLFAVDLERHATQAYFRRRYDADLGYGFWRASFGGESVALHAARRAVDRLRRLHAFYEVAAGSGLVDGADFESVERRWRECNARLERAVREGEPVYGLSRYDFGTYLMHEMAALEERYCSDPSLPGMAVGDDEAERFFRSGSWTVDGRGAEFVEVRAHVMAELRKHKFVNIVNNYADAIVVEGVPWRALRALVEQTAMASARGGRSQPAK